MKKVSFVTLLCLCLIAIGINKGHTQKADLAYITISNASDTTPASSSTSGHTYHKKSTKSGTNSSTKSSSSTSTGTDMSGSSSSGSSTSGTSGSGSTKSHSSKSRSSKSSSSQSGSKTSGSNRDSM